MGQRKAKEERRLIRAVNKRLLRGGTIERVQRVREVLQGPRFAARFQQTLTPELSDLEAVRALALKVLAEDFRCDVSDVLLTFAWDPVTRKLDISSHPAPPAVVAAIEADRRARMH
jgi:hypothetical protein